MAEESKGIALAILGIVAVIAIIGLVLMFSKMRATGDVYGGGLTWGEGGWQSQGLATRQYILNEQPTVVGGGKLGGQTNYPYQVLSRQGSAYESEIGVSDCAMAVAAGYVPAPYSFTVEYSKAAQYGYDCITLQEPLASMIPGKCCKWQAWG